MESSTERRKTSRYTALKGTLLAFFPPSHEESEGHGLLLDVSKGGCRVTSDVPLIVSHYYRVIIQAISRQQITIETAVVCWGCKSVYGLKFITFDQDQEELLLESLLQLKPLV
jgi:hypothetical protein